MAEKLDEATRIGVALDLRKLTPEDSVKAGIWATTVIFNEATERGVKVSRPSLYKREDGITEICAPICQA